MRKSPSPHPVTAAFDRGPAKYFHGRKDILHDFSELVTRATQAKSGTTFLIQGAPGAGKTALLTECESLAQKDDWETAEISSVALWDTHELQRSLKLRRTWKVGGGSARVGISGIGEAEINAERSPQTVKNLLRGGKTPLLLTLDEAQVLGKEALIPPDHLNTVVDVLNSIHKGRLGRPVILIAAGVGTTADGFESLGISRFAADAFVELGALGKEAERRVLHDWLKKEGGAKGNPTAWIDAIAQETHGWPQHILSYMDPPAMEQLREHRREMTAEGLNAVLEAGRARRAAYYEQRVRGFDEELRQNFARLFVDIPLGGSITGSAVRSSLTQEYGFDEAKELFRRAVSKGIIDGRNGRYVIPVPSMQDWLVSKYGRDTEKRNAIEIDRAGPREGATAIVTQKKLDQEIPTQSPGQSRDVEDRDSFFGR
ncbi:MAG: hypothetical protein OXD43_03080 [Bacteroidetes bacterium]|nr:hypothetical protein [Bacteroidota bacterium]